MAQYNMACSVDGTDMSTISLLIVFSSLMVETMETLIHVAKGGNGGRLSKHVQITPYSRLPLKM
jgi:hypothetical protein